MNQRIKELVLEVQIQAARETTQNSFEYEAKVFGKFAELIVRECANAIINDSRLNDVRSAANGCVRTIREHFGVEE